METDVSVSQYEHIIAGIVQSPDSVWKSTLLERRSSCETLFHDDDEDAGHITIFIWSMGPQSSVNSRLGEL